MINKIIKKYRFKRMFNEKNIISHSVVMIDNLNEQLNANKDSHIPFQINNQLQEFANSILINNILKKNNITELATPLLTQIPIEKVFKTDSFIFKSELGRFGIWQNAGFEKLLSVNLFKSLIEYDGNNIFNNNITAIGINYSNNLNINDEQASKLLFQLTQDRIHSVNERKLKTGSIKLSYILNEYCLLNISIFKDLTNNKWLIDFNADNKVCNDNTLDTILNYNFYKEYKDIASFLCSNI